MATRPALAALMDPDIDLDEDEAPIAEANEDRVPNLDLADADAPPPATYRDWRLEDTRVVTFTNTPEKYPRDTYAESISKARAQCELVHGRILETNAVPGRWFFRVRR